MLHGNGEFTVVLHAAHHLGGAIESRLEGVQRLAWPVGEGAVVAGLGEDAGQLASLGGHVGQQSLLAVGL